MNMSSAKGKSYLNRNLKDIDSELDGVHDYLMDLYKKQGGSLNKVSAQTINECLIKNEKILANLNAVDKTTLLNTIKGVSSQPQLYKLIKPLKVVDQGYTVSLPYYIAVAYDSEYKQGVDKANSPAYDGKCHDFGKDKWQLSGDNAPCSLRQAIEQAVKAVKENVVFK